MSSSHYQSGHAWGQSASIDATARAQRVVRVATDASRPDAVLRMVLRARTSAQFESLVDAYFGGMPTLPEALDFARGVGDATPRPVAATA